MSRLTTVVMLPFETIIERETCDIVGPVRWRLMADNTSNRGSVVLNSCSNRARIRFSTTVAQLARRSHSCSDNVRCGAPPSLSRGSSRPRPGRAGPGRASLTLSPS